MAAWRLTQVDLYRLNHGIVQRMKGHQPPRPGRPPHKDDPPEMVGTTVPKSVNRLLKQLSTTLDRPKSEVLAEAIRAYAALHSYIKHIKKKLDTNHGNYQKL